MRKVQKLVQYPVVRIVYALLGDEEGDESRITRYCASGSSAGRVADAYWVYPPTPCRYVGYCMQSPAAASVQ